MQTVYPTQPIIEAISDLESTYKIKFKQCWRADFVEGKFPMKYGNDPVCFEIDSIQEMNDNITINSSSTLGYCYFDYNGDEWLVAIGDIEKEFHQLLEEMDAKSILRGWKLKQLI
jgi:hypothetical protein